MPRLGAALVVLTAVAAIAGPNLAPPPAPWLFAFRILIVVLGLGLVAYLLMDGRLVLPAGVPRPAGLLGGLGALVGALAGLGRRHGGRAALDPLPDHDGRPGDRDRAALPRAAAGPHPALGARGRLRRGVPGGPGRDRHRPPPAHLARGAAAGPVRGDLVLRQREQLRHLPHADAPVPRGDPALRARRAPEGGRLRREHPGAADDPDHRQQVGPDLGRPDPDRAAGDRGARPRVARAAGRGRGDRRPDRGPAGAGDARLGPAGAVAAGRDQARLRPAARADREPDRVGRRARVAARRRGSPWSTTATAWAWAPATPRPA